VNRLLGYRMMKMKRRMKRRKKRKRRKKKMKKMMRRKRKMKKRKREEERTGRALSAQLALVPSTDPRTPTPRHRTGCDAWLQREYVQE
jgi:hypothetical protein